MKKIIITLIIVSIPLLMFAQQADSAKVVNFGVRINANLSQPVLHGIPRDIVASPTVGVEGGMFLDFNIGRRFFIRFNTLYGPVKSSYQKVEDGVVKGYKTIENGVVSGYTAVQDGVVEGFTRISDAFVKKFLMREGETLEEAKARIAREEEKLHRQNRMK